MLEQHQYFFGHTAPFQTLQSLPDGTNQFRILVTYFQPVGLGDTFFLEGFGGIKVSFPVLVVGFFRHTPPPPLSAC